MEHIQDFEKPPRVTLKRSLIIFIGNVIGIYLIIIFGLGIPSANFDDVMLFVIFTSIINALLWPILTRIFMPFLVLTFGVGTLILNGLILQFFGPLFYISVEGPAIILAPLSMALVTTLLSTLLTIEDDGSYYRSVYRDAEKKRKKETKKYPGLIIIEIDGLAYDVLKEAIDKGLMPTVKSMIDNKTHTLRMWETDLSSQTGASQAGILHGNNENITAFRWIEKENDNQMMQCSGVDRVKILEERISDGNGLLVDNGASRSNLFSGDTDNVIFTFSKILNLRKLYNRAWFSVFSNPSNFARIVCLFLAEMILEIISQIMYRALNTSNILRQQAKKDWIYNGGWQIQGMIEMLENKEVAKLKENELRNFLGTLKVYHEFDEKINNKKLLLVHAKAPEDIKKVCDLTISDDDSRVYKAVWTRKEKRMNTGNTISYNKIGKEGYFTIIGHTPVKKDEGFILDKEENTLNIDGACASYAMGKYSYDKVPLVEVRDDHLEILIFNHNNKIVNGYYHDGEKHIPMTEDELNNRRIFIEHSYDNRGKEELERLTEYLK